MSRKHILIIALCLATAAVVGIALYFFNPVGTWWMPRCIFFVATGLKCPACGSMRAIHAAVHGHWLEALTHNIMLPVLWIIAGVAIYRYIWHRQSDNSRWIYAYLGVYCAWWVVRNIAGL